MHIAYPFRIASDGGAANAGNADHIEQMIEQLLFTVPGERVNLPDFGTPVMQLVFRPGSDELATAAKFMIQGALQQYLGDVIQVQAVQVNTDDSTVSVKIAYTIKSTQQTQVAEFSR